MNGLKKKSNWTVIYACAIDIKWEELQECSQYKVTTCVSQYQTGQTVKRNLEQ